MDYVELIEETPAFTLFKLSIRQFLYVLIFPFLLSRKGGG